MTNKPAKGLVIPLTYRSRSVHSFPLELLKAGDNQAGQKSNKPQTPRRETVWLPFLHYTHPETKEHIIILKGGEGRYKFVHAQDVPTTKGNIRVIHSEPLNMDISGAKNPDQHATWHAQAMYHNITGQPLAKLMSQGGQPIDSFKKANLIHDYHTI